VPDRLLVDLIGGGQAAVLSWPDGGQPQEVSRGPVTWPLDADALEDLRWYLEDYLLAPFGVWEDRGPAVQGNLAGWGEAVFGSVFGAGPARDEYQRARDRGLEVMFRSADPQLLALPWELMRDRSGPLALEKGGISRSVPAAGGSATLEVPGGRLRVLVVISRPAGTADVGYQIIARPLLERLETIRGEVELTVLRPPTFRALRDAVRQAADTGQPFHVVHFDGHGGIARWTGEGVLAFELPGGGSGYVEASRVAAALAAGQVPVVVLNACQSGAVGKELETSVATALLTAGCSAVVAMAYSVYAVAAAEFMSAFYESLFTGVSVGQAVTAGRRRLFQRDSRPSPKGDMPLEDWLVPVHYLREEVTFPQARIARPASAPSLDEALDQIRAAPSEAAAARDPLAAVDGVFVGRDDLFYRLESAARLRQVVVLTGPGGAGKTELAKGFARWWRDTGGVDDPRLVFWHSFEPGVASFGLDGVISALGLAIFGPDFARLDWPQRLDAVRQLLTRYRGLLVWDNFESVQEMPDPARATPPLDDAGCDALKGFLEWVRDHSRSAVLITSRARETWLGQVSRIGLGGLNRAEAALYADHLLAPYPAAQRRREHRSFGELLEWLDGHPLAMRLTLPRLDSTDPAILLSDLRGTTPVLGTDIPDADRTMSLAASITYSYAHLGEETRRLLPAVSLFYGIADEDVLWAFSAVETVPGRFAGTSKDEWSAALGDASRVGLLTELGAGMYQVHPALPGYLAAQWAAGNPADDSAERQECEHALCTAYAAFSIWLKVQIESGDAALAYTVIGLERRTMGAMLGHALDRHAWGDAERITSALDAYWETYGLREEEAAWADRILAAATSPRSEPFPPARSLWLHTIIRQATRHADARELGKAAQTYEEILSYLQAQPESEWTRRNAAIVYNQLGIIAHMRGLMDEAEDWSLKSLAIKEEHRDHRGMLSSYHLLGMTAADRERLDEADDWYRKALAVEEELGDRPHMAATYHELAVTARKRRQPDEADRWLRKALAVEVELGDRPHMAATYDQLGLTARARGRLDEADDWYRKALVIDEELGDRPGMASEYHHLGITAYMRGDLDEAEDWYGRAVAIREELGDRPGLADIYDDRGEAAQARGRLDEAEGWYGRAVAIKEELGDRPGLADTYHQLGMAAQACGQLDQAEDWYRSSLAIDEELGNSHGMALSYAQLGLLAEDRAQIPQALTWNIRCVTLFSEFPSPLTGSGPSALARLSRQFGLPSLELAWQQVTGQRLPQQVRDYIDTYHSDESSQP